MRLCQIQNFLDLVLQLILDLAVDLSRFKPIKPIPSRFFQPRHTLTQNWKFGLALLVYHFQVFVEGLCQRLVLVQLVKREYSRQHLFYIQFLVVLVEHSDPLRALTDYRETQSFRALQLLIF